MRTGIGEILNCYYFETKTTHIFDQFYWNALFLINGVTAKIYSVTSGRKTAKYEVDINCLWCELSEVAQL